MQPLQPEQAHFLFHELYLPAMKHEQRITQSVIEAIPRDQGDYRPDEISKSALDLAWHIVAAEMRFMNCVPAGEFDFSPTPRPDAIKDSADLAAWYNDNFERSFAALAEVTDHQLLKILGFRGIFQLPAVMYLNFLRSHTTHHRGQLCMYLRPMGAKVPSIYGESHDAVEARKAAQRVG